MDAAHISQEQADEFAIGSLEPEFERPIAVHIAECSACRDLVRDAERVAASLAVSVPMRRPNRRLRRRVWKAAGIEGPGVLTRIAMIAPAAAGIAASIVAIAAFTGMISVRGQIQDLRNENVALQDQIDSTLSQKVQIAALTQRVSDEERTSAELRQAADGDRDLLVAIMAPESDVAEVLSVDPNAPSAVGRLIWDNEQTRVWFVAAHLPERPPGETYQIWVSSGGRYISLGTFNSDESGFARYDTTLPQGLKKYDTALVTIERSGGAPERSGNAVFVTDLSRLNR
jgi:anti-sigma-K factor RskA